MTVVHNDRHPRAEEVLVPSNEEIAKKFGEVRVEDWEDRVRGETWTESYSRRSSAEIAQYVSDAIGKGPGVHGDGTHEVVRCHSTRTGDLILLHNEWL